METTSVNTVGDLNSTSGANTNCIFTNITLMSLLLNTLNETVLKGRTSFDAEYDYIIIGGGSAGAVMASRLSQHPCVKVLLLEAGGEQPLLTEVPGIASSFFNTEVDWAYLTTPQKHSGDGQNENTIVWHSGKMLGGGSSLNAMLYVRGNKENYNEWSQRGCKGWSYEDVLPYFLKQEDNQNYNEVDKGYHSRGGPLTVEKPRYNPSLKNHAIEALQSLGYLLTDVNGRRQFGIYDPQGTIRNQERCSTTKAYLKPASGRPNLHIVTHALVRKILIKQDEKGQNRAYGVEVEHNGTIHTVQIRTSGPFNDGVGEVIVSNGAVRTAQTLMLSGIGPKEHLQKFGIPVIADLPVGQNLMDHNAAALYFETDSSNRNTCIQDITQYAVFRSGPLCRLDRCVLILFSDGLNNTSASEDFPMQEVYFEEFDTEDAIGVLNLKDDIANKVMRPYVGKSVFSCYSQLLQPYSRGEITLNSTDPNEFPLINPNYYSDSRDEFQVVQGLKICLAAAKTPAMQKMKAKWIETQRKGYPGCEQFESDEDKYLGCLAKSVVLTIWHPSGTARMGDPKDNRTVVDPELRVLGIDKLRVINAAVMPIITSGNTNVPTMMIAEKGYDMMKDSIKCRSKYTLR